MRLVFIHFGPGYPPWLIANAVATRQRFSVTPMVASNNLRVLREFESKGLDALELRPGIDFSQINIANPISPRFREGFWIHSAERLVALPAIHDRLGNESILHVESDMLLLSGMDFARFDAQEFPILISSVSGHLGSAAIVYTRTAESATDLGMGIRRFLSESRNQTEMQALGRLIHERRSRIGLLPTAPYQDSKLFSGDTPDWLRFDVMKGRRDFDGVFDVAEIGQYITGTDPRNKRGLIRYAAPRYSFGGNPGALRYEVSGGQLWLRECLDQNWVRLLSLHIHSKSQSLLGAVDPFPLLAERVSKGRGGAYSEFNFGAFITSIRDTLRL